MVNELIIDGGHRMPVLTSADIVPCDGPLYSVIRACVQALLDRHTSGYFSLTLANGKVIEVDDADGCMTLNQVLGNSLEDLKHVLCDYAEEHRRTPQELVA